MHLSIENLHRIIEMLDNIQEHTDQGYISVEGDIK